MSELDTALRLIIVGQLLLVALLFLSGRGNLGARASGALLVVSIAVYLIESSTTLRSSLTGPLSILVFLSFATPYFIWAFVKKVFDSPLPANWLMAVFVAAGLGIWLTISGSESGAMSESAVAARQVLSLIIVLNALWVSAIERRDDLLQQRRQFRTVFATLISIQAIVVLSVELAFGTSGPPAWLSMLNVVIIGAMTMGLSIFLLRLNEQFFPASAVTPVDNAAETKPQLNAAERVLYDKLINSMDAGDYRETGLTITALASKLGYPEHQLRRLINRHLGYRNFSAFLNGYRIDEAKAKLGDPEFARTPVLTIALGLGYGSLGPFNRAFKEYAGMTPSEYREQAIPAGSE